MRLQNNTTDDNMTPEEIEQIGKALEGRKWKADINPDDYNMILENFCFKIWMKAYNTVMLSYGELYRPDAFLSLREIKKAVSKQTQKYFQEDLPKFLDKYFDPV